MDPIIGMIFIFAGNFEIRDYAFCNGQLLSISQNTALFSILGTTYGGNGQTTFALPDLRGRTPIHFGQGPGLSSIALGEAGGTETTTLIASQLPAHNHTIPASNLPGTLASPTGAVMANSGNLDKEYNPSSSANTTMASTGIAGGNLPISLRNPYLGLNYQIALFGIYPSRN